jgi:hypothetical protein
VAPVDLDNLWQVASARWAEIGAKSPDLASPVALQQRLVHLTLEVSSRLDAVQLPEPPASLILDKWRRGQPAFSNELLPIPPFLGDFLPAFCTALAEGGAGDSALHIRDALTSGGIDAGSLLSVSLARNQKAIRTSALHMGFSPDLVWLVGELGSAPLAHLLQSRLLARAEADGVGPVLRAWQHGYCPCCGSWPVFIELYEHTRALRCSFCAASYPGPSGPAGERLSRQCIYCGNSGEHFFVAAPDVAQPNRRVELCGACGSYTKAIEVSAPTPFPLLAIEDLATTDLDVGAMSREYRRPSLREF